MYGIEKCCLGYQLLSAESEGFLANYGQHSNSGTHHTPSQLLR